MVKPILYQDFDSNFTPHPITGDVVLLKNEKSISQAIRNLVLTSRYESPYNSNKSGRVYESLFENFDPVILKVLEDNVKRVIQNFEPRAIVEKVLVSQFAEAQINKTGVLSDDYDKQFGNDLDSNRIYIQVVYRPINAREPVTLDVIVEKIR